MTNESTRTTDETKAQATLDALGIKIQAQIDSHVQYETSHDDAGCAYSVCVDEGDSHAMAIKIEQYIESRGLMTTAQWDLLGDDVINRCFDNYEWKPGHVFSSPDADGCWVFCVPLQEIEIDLQLTDDELQLVGQLGNEFCINTYQGGGNRTTQALAYECTDAMWIAWIDDESLTEIVKDLIDESKELRVPTLTATIVHQGLVDYWGGNSRRWDDDAGCLFSSFDGSTTVRQLIDGLTEDFMTGGDCDSMWDFDREPVRKAITACFKPECIDERIDGDLPAGDEDECCESPVVIVLLEESYDTDE